MRWIMSNGKDILFWTIIAIFLTHLGRLLQVVDNDIVRKICIIPVPRYNNKDFFVWEHSSKWEFSIKSTT
ncbi:unnamed protein product [Malus baccata var. baccata]